MTVANERTTWIFDFTADPNVSLFPTSVPLSDALLTLTLTPKTALIVTDGVRIEGLPTIITPIIQTLPVNITNTIQLELLDFYSSSEILDVFVADLYAQIPMLYYDDAIVSFAQLDLTPVPLPSTLLLLGTSTIGMIGYRYRRRKQTPYYS